MSALTFFRAAEAGVDKVTLTQGEGLTSAPHLSSAVCWASNRVRLTFDSEMLSRMPTGLVGEISSYNVYETAHPENIIPVMQVIIQHGDPTAVDLYCHGMTQDTGYTAEVIGDVLDVYGIPIDHDYDTADFTGIGHPALVPGTLDVFIALEAGLQKITESGWRPDVTPPYTQNPYPPPGGSGILHNVVPTIELKDSDTGVRAASTKLWVKGILVYQNEVGEAGWPVNRVAIANGYRYELNHDALFSGGDNIIIRIYGEDLAYSPNSVDYTWNFITLQNAPPYIINKDPSPNSTGVKKDKNIFFYVADDFNQVTLASIIIWVRHKIIFKGGTFAAEWSRSSFTSLSRGFVFTLIPATVWQKEEIVTVRCFAQNTALRQVDDTWQFTREGRPFNFSIYRFVFDGLRRGDEGD